MVPEVFKYMCGSCEERILELLKYSLLLLHFFQLFAKKDKKNQILFCEYPSITGDINTKASL